MEFQGTGFQNLGSWLSRLIRLDLTVFDDVRDDVTATAPALLVVLVASFAAGLGSWLWWVQGAPGKDGEAFLKTFILGGLFQTVLWVLWVYIAAMILSRLFGASADLSQMMRTMGLAFAPMVIAILMVIDILAVPFGVIAIAATLLLSNAAVQAATDAEPRQVILANVAGFAVFAIILGILANVAQIFERGGLAPGLFFVSLDF